MTPKNITIAPSETGRTLAAVIKARFELSWSQARALIAAGQIRINGGVCTDAVRRLALKDRVSAGSQLEQMRPRPGKRVTQAPSAPADINIIYSDDDVVVVNKPPGLTTVRHAAEAAEFGSRGRRYLPKTLADQLAKLFPGRRLRAVHRLDKDTSGLVVFARTPDAERHLGKQFRNHTIARRYLAIVRGQPTDGRIESWLIRDRGDGRRGSGGLPGHGDRAITHVRVIESMGDCSLVECRLQTGRTHQIRIHLGETGTPLAGETLYDRPIHGAPAPDPSGADRIALHAASIGFVHPRTGEWTDWETPLPADLQAIIRRLRERRAQS